MNYSSFIKLIVFCSISFSCSNTEKVMFPNPEIKAGIANISGRIINFSLEESKTKPVISLCISCPVTVDQYIIETELDENGNFSFEAPIECSTVFSMISIPGYEGVMIELSSLEEIKIELKLDGSFHIIRLENATRQSLLTNEDRLNYRVALMKYNSFFQQQMDLPQYCDMTPEEYVHFEMELMPTRINYAMDEIELSDAGRKFTFNELQLFHLGGVLLSYKSRVEMFCGNEENWSYQEPDIQDYSFLKSFDLNNPQYLCNNFFSNTMQALLSVKALNIPAISNTPVEEWINNVKTILSNLVGFDSGQFYDLLAAHAYAKQLKEEVNPLSKTQVKNIKDYFKGNKEEIAKILLRKNEEIINLAEIKDPLVINETPQVNKEKLIDAIISKYKGKIVIVDFWATWCGPCLDAMKHYKSIKGELISKNVVFVYLTNNSSPTILWEDKIKSIRGEHYYLKENEWEYLTEYFGFDGIPSYVIFDAKGEIHNKFTGYPGNTELLAMIDKLLL